MKNTVWERQLGKKNDSGEKEYIYSDVIRPDLLDFITISPQIAVDIGCNMGGTFAHLKKRFPQCKTIGIELNKNAAKIAAKRLDQVIIGHFEDIDMKANHIAAHSVDFVLLADVLEHMVDPWHTLVRLKDWVSPYAQIVISIPNLRYLPAMDDLAHGYFRYADAGVLDITHLRFFTRKEMQKMLYETGWTIEKIIPAMDPPLMAQENYEQYAQNLPCNVQTDKISIHVENLEELQELFSGQFIILARPWQGLPLNDYDETPQMTCGFWQGKPNAFLEFLNQQRTPDFERQRYLQNPLNPTDSLLCLFIVFNNGNDKDLQITLNSLAEQIERHFKILIVGEKKPQVPENIYHQSIFVKMPNSSPPPAFVENLRQQTPPPTFFAVLNAGDFLMPEALALLKNFEKKNESTVVFCDEALCSEANNIVSFSLKPDFSPDYFVAAPLSIGKGIFYRHAHLDKVGGFAGLLPTLFNVLETFGESAFWHLPSVVFGRKQNAFENVPVFLLQSFFKKQNRRMQIVHGKIKNTFYATPILEKNATLAWITEMPKTLDACRIVFEECFLPTAQSKKIEVNLLAIVPPDILPDARAYLEGITRMQLPNVYFLVPDANQTFMQMADALIHDCNADLILLINSSCLLTTPKTLETWAAFALNDDIASVAPNLLDEKNALLGNAMILGTAGIACGFAFKKQAHQTEDSLLENRHLLPQNPSALSLDAQMFRREVYLKTPFETKLSPNAAAIDWCLKQEKRLLWLPFLELKTVFFQTQPIAQTEADFLMTRHGKKIARDPFYNPNFSHHAPFELHESPQTIRQRLDKKAKRARVLAYPCDSMGCGFVRMIDPVLAASESGAIDGELPQDACDKKVRHLHHALPNVFDLVDQNVRTLFLMRIADQNNQAQLLKTYKQYLPHLKIVYDLDDLLFEIPKSNPHFKERISNEETQTRRIVDCCDTLTVSTEYLKMRLKNWHNNIVVVPNRLRRKRWEHFIKQKTQRTPNKKLRIGYSGSLSHTGDVAVIQKLVEKTAQEVDWIFMGYVPEQLRPFLSEYHPFVPVAEYPQTLNAMRLDVAVIPLEHNNFNRAKSNLKVLEFGVLGVPVIASDFGPYQNPNFPLVRVENRMEAWINAIENANKNRDSLKTQGEELQRAVLNFGFLEEHLDEWQKAWLE